MISHSQKKQPADGFLKSGNDGLGKSPLPYNLSKGITGGRQAPLASHNYGNVPLFSSNNIVQAKLPVNTSGDKYEQEADAVADKIIGKTDSKSERKNHPSININHKIDTGNKKTSSGQVISQSSVQETLQATGRQIDTNSRSFMEQHFGFDFSNVKIHNDPTANKSAKEINANAYTHENHVVFGTGQYQPDTVFGKRLLAHELTHVVQQEGTQKSGVVQKQDDKTTKPEEKKPADTPKTEEVPKTDDASAPKPEGVKGMKVFCSIFDDLFGQWPERWKQSYTTAKKNYSTTLFDPAFGKKLISDEIMSLWNIYNAALISETSPYEDKADFLTSLKMAEQLTGVSDTWLNLASILLHKDLKLYLSEDLPAYAKDNIGIFLISGALLQGGLVGLNALTNGDLDFTSVLGPATSKFTKAPMGLKRPFVLDNIPDPRWKSPFGTTPDKLESKYTGTNDEATAKTFSLSLGFNYASFKDLYPKDETEEPKYKGFELYPYLGYTHNDPIMGEPAPAEEHKLLAGIFIGDKGYYSLIEGGARLNGTDLLEAYGRAGFTMKHFGALSMLQLTGEMDYRPGNDTAVRGRINAATSIELLDTEAWQLKLGAAVGGLLPTGDATGAMDFRAGLSLQNKQKDFSATPPLISGIDLSLNAGKQDSFDANSPDMFGVHTGLTFLDTFKLGVEYFKINDQTAGLPSKDLRLVFAIDLAPYFMPQK